MDVTIQDGNTVITSNRLESSIDASSELTYVFDQGIQKAGSYMLTFANSASAELIRYALEVNAQSAISSSKSTFEVLNVSSPIVGEVT